MFPSNFEDLPIKRLEIHHNFNEYVWPRELDERGKIE